MTKVNDCKPGLRRQTMSLIEVCAERPVFMLRVGVWSIVIAFILFSRTTLALYQGTIVAFAVYILTGGWRFLYVFIVTVPRDVKGLLRYIELKWYMKRCSRLNSTVTSEFAEIVRKYPNKKCFLHEDKVWTFKEVDEFSNRVANSFSKAGYRKGDVVALLMESSPEYVGIWLGLAKYNRSEAKVLIFGKEFINVVKEVQGPLNHDFKYYCFGDFDSNVITAQPLNKFLEESSVMPPPLVLCNQKDRLMYIYTSGTTGLPKPAIIHHARYIFISAGIRIMMHVRFNDVAQYIGEICRYLLASPPKPTDTEHRVRLIFGNGLRSQIWKPFVGRFRVKEIGEIYGSTEGNANIVNIDNQPNAVGFVSRIAPWAYPVTLIRIDKDTNEPLRDKNGLCIQCKPDEPGEFVGKIINSDPVRDFSGYVNEKATEKKIVHSVLERAIPHSCQEIWCEGRAGMAAIFDEYNTLDLKALARGVYESLAPYARPLFVRIVKEVDMTGTYKLRKVDFQMQGINPKVIKKDKLFYLNSKTSQYEVLDEQVYESICNEKIRL
uniref:Long-chain-fatty-acid--CoA ligase n=1 Tax=Strigamia maritima TaxID=126957 RepID=T1IVL5_STRMM